MADGVASPTNPPRGMGLFAVIWSGQFFSLLGTYMTAFALTIWAWQATGLALVALFSFAPTVLMEPIAGVLVDRWNRKLVMIISSPSVRGSHGRAYRQRGPGCS